MTKIIMPDDALTVKVLKETVTCILAVADANRNYPTINGGTTMPQGYVDFRVLGLLAQEGYLRNVGPARYAIPDSSLETLRELQAWIAPIRSPKMELSARYVGTLLTQLSKDAAERMRLEVSA